MEPHRVLEFARENEVRFVDIKFTDLSGRWQHLGLPVQELGTPLFESGVVLDTARGDTPQPTGLSGFRVTPDPGTARLDPFPKAKTLSLIGTMVDRASGAPLPWDPRHIARKCEAHLLASGIADAAWVAPQVEFFVFDEVRYDQTPNSAFYFIDAEEGRWNSGRDEGPNLGYKQPSGESGRCVPPGDSLLDLRQETVTTLAELGIQVTSERRGNAGAGQACIDLKRMPLLQQADALQWTKYVVKNIARLNGKAATFMPKPLFGSPGSGLATHWSLHRGQQNLFAGDGYEGLSPLALWFVGGVLRHTPALCALCNPTTNSYRRLAWEDGAPVHLAHAVESPTAAVRVLGPNAALGVGIEYRTPDPACSGYLALSAMLMAGLDGIENRIDPGEPMGTGHAGAEDRTPAGHTPRAFSQALDALETDHDFLLRGGVFDAAMVALYLDYHRSTDVEPLRQRPTPWDFARSFDC